MKNICLVNPSWHLMDTPIGMGCQEPHTPLELLYALSLMDNNGEGRTSGSLVDAHLMDYSHQEAVTAIMAHQPDCIVITTAPGYGAWRTPPSDLSLPAALIKALKAAMPDTPILACGPQGSTSPDEALATLACDGIIRGEPEEVIAGLDKNWASEPCVYTPGKHPWNVDKATVTMSELPAIDYSLYPTESIRHVHRSLGPLNDQTLAGVDVEWSRGCQYSCTFCNRLDFRFKYRERPIETVITELVALKKAGIHYVYFIDDLFGLGKTPDLLIEMRRRQIPAFGIQTRPDLWDEKGIDFLAAAGCCHVEFGLESPILQVQQGLHRDYLYTLKRTEEVLLHAVARIHSVQVTLMEPDGLSAEDRQWTLNWREEMLSKGCWVSEPAKIFPYPGTLYFRQKVAPAPINAEGQWQKANKFYAMEATPI